MQPKTETKLIYILLLLVSLALIFGIYNSYMAGHYKDTHDADMIKAEKNKIMANDSIKTLVLKVQEEKLNARYNIMIKKMDSIQKELINLTYENKKLLRSYSDIIVNMPDF